MPAARPVKQTTPDPVRILLIDGEHESTERLLIDALERIEWAYTCIDTAATLRQALARLKLEKFDLVITALDLPDAPGLATLDEVARACDRVIVALTADADPLLRDRVIAHGGADVLPRGEVSAAALGRLLQLATGRSGGARSLRDSEARFRKTLELAGSGIAHLDLDGRLLRVNRKLCDILGYAESELVGRELQQLAHRDDDSPAGTERRYVRKDGAAAWVRVNATQVRDAAGNPHYEICVIEDISERKLAEARRAAHGRWQDALAGFGQAALELREPRELIEEAVRTLTRAIPAREVAYIEAGDAVGVSAGLVDVLHCGVHFVCPGNAIVPVRRGSEVRGALSAQGERVDAEALPFLNTLASLLSTALQRIDSERRLSFLAQFDSLTGLANRALLTERLSQMIESAKRRGTPLAVLFIDLDHFKLVNDALQHAGGDELLAEMALRVQAAVRIGDMVARVNGDEFAVVLSELEKAEDAALVAQKVLEALAQRFMVRGKETFITASIGIAAHPADGGSAEDLIRAAEAATHRAKQAGRNGYQFFASEITQRTRVRAQLSVELRRALERDEFRLLYQPKIDLGSGRPCGAEALLRWHHPERGVMPPAQFVPVLEETGLIVPVGEWVMARACEDLKAWRAAGLRVLPVAVNLSARQFRQQHLDRRIRALVQAAGIDPALIELEITESQLMEDPDHAVRVMHALRDSGIRAAIDDFGTGYSSLAYLRRLPLAALKIDRSFVADALTDAADAAIVRTIIDMAHTLNFTVVAEGVETDGQMAFLRRFGCEQGQGFLFAYPMSAADFSALISSATEGTSGKGRPASRYQ